MLCFMLPEPLQRRHQKILEETPSPFVQAPLRAELQGAALRLGQIAKYR
jgi:acetyl/propionyl-CoA carboxylase alpha subunit